MGEREARRRVGSKASRAKETTRARGQSLLSSREIELGFARASRLLFASVIRCRLFFALCARVRIHTYVRSSYIPTVPIIAKFDTPWIRSGIDRLPRTYLKQKEKQIIRKLHVAWNIDERCV